MSNVSNRIPIGVTERSRKDLSCLNITSTDFGRLDVAGSWELIPGDDVDLDVSLTFQNAPMPVNTYGRFWIDVRAFFVPYRIMTGDKHRTDNFSWEKFIANTSNTQHPYLTLNRLVYTVVDPENIELGVGNSIPNTIQDTEDFPLRTAYLKDLRRHLSKLRIPEAVYNATSVASYIGELDRQLEAGPRVNCWKFAAYQYIWWTYYRDSQQIDETLFAEYVPFLQAGSQNRNIWRLVQPRYCCFKKDYFTLARIFPQSDQSSSVAQFVSLGSSSSNVSSVYFNPNNVLQNDGLIKSLPNTSGVPATWLRSALSLQKYLERNNLVGTRLMARFLARFGVAPSYERLSQPEYIGGYRKMCVVGDVVSPTGTGGNMDNEPFSQETMYSVAGQRVGMLNINSGMDKIKYHATEFGTLMVIHTLVPEVHYIQGIEREWQRGVTSDKFDYFTPELQDVGDQIIRESEIYFPPSEETEQTPGGFPSLDGVFGWTRRYEDYCYKPDIVSGDLTLKETSAGLESVHLARIFDSKPILAPEFTELGPAQRLQFDRIFNVPGKVGEFDHFKGYVNCRCSMVRPMSGAPAPELEEDATNHVVVPNGGVRF